MWFVIPRAEPLARRHHASCEFWGPDHPFRRPLPLPLGPTLTSYSSALSPLSAGLGTSAPPPTRLFPRPGLAPTIGLLSFAPPARPGAPGEPVPAAPAAMGASDSSS